MQSLVVLLAVVSAVCGSYIAQPAHHPALVLDPHGRPLDTAEVISARALHLQAKALEHAPLAHAAVVAPIAPLAHAAVVAPVAHAAVVAPVAHAAAVSHQSRVDVRSSPAVVAHGYAAPLLAHSAYGLAGHGHYLKRRSLSHYAYAAPAAVSHQSRVDVRTSPAVVAHAVAPVLAHAAPVVAHAPVLAPAAVSHQSRVDVRTSPAVAISYAAPLAHSYAAPLAHSYVAHAAPLHYASAIHGHGLHY